MKKFKLSDLSLGIADGKKEALLIPDFEKYFFDHNDQYASILKPETYVVLGKKGSGKTILAEYVKKLSMLDPNSFVEIISFKEFKFHELVQLKTTDLQPNEYLSIWQWVILLNLAKICLDDFGIKESRDKENLRCFFEENYSSIKITTKRILEITKKNKIKGSLLKISGETAEDKKFSTGSYLEYIEDLKNVLFRLLQISNSKYTLFLDDLDDRFRHDEYYKNSIISLIKAVDQINVELLQNSCAVKSVILLRSDIYSTLNDPDLNKIRETNTLFIDWGYKASKESPLIKLVLNKARQSSGYLSGKSDSKIFNLLFPDYIKRVSPERFLLERTLFRPRDVIVFLNKIKDDYPYESAFRWKCFLKKRRDYSQYFLQELRNEISGHIPDDELDAGITLLKNFNKASFTFNELKEYHEKNIIQFENIKLMKILPLFFKFNIIGNKWYQKDVRSYYYCWAYRDNNAEIDFSKMINVHRGLREELSLTPSAKA